MFWSHQVLQSCGRCRSGGQRHPHREDVCGCNFFDTKLNIGPFLNMLFLFMIRLKKYKIKMKKTTQKWLKKT